MHLMQGTDGCLNSAAFRTPQPGLNGFTRTLTVFSGSFFRMVHDRLRMCVDLRQIRRLNEL